MQNPNRLLDIAKEACRYARYHIKESETAPGVEYVRRYQLSEREFKIRKEMERITDEICKKFNIESTEDPRHRAIHMQVLEKLTILHQIGNCEEYSVLAFNYIRKNYPALELNELNLEILGINKKSHIVVSLGDHSHRVICDPSLNLVFELSNEPHKLHFFSASKGCNRYTPYSPLVHNVEVLSTNESVPFLDKEIRDFINNDYFPSIQDSFYFEKEDNEAKQLLEVLEKYLAANWDTDKPKELPPLIRFHLRYINDAKQGQTPWREAEKKVRELAGHFHSKKKEPVDYCELFTLEDREKLIENLEESVHTQKLSH